MEPNLIWRASMFTESMLKACKEGKLKIVRFFCRSTPQVIPSYAQQAAIRQGHIHIYHHFIFELNLIPNLSWMLIAASSGQLDILVDLVTRGIAVTMEVVRAGMFSCNVEVVRWLCEQHAPNEHCLECAAITGDLSVVRYLVEKHHVQVTLNAMEHSQGAVLKYFILDLRLFVPEHVFITAAIYGYTGNLRFLVEQQLPLPPRLLRHAARYGNIEIVKLLVECGQNIHEGNEYALRWAARKGHVHVVRFLLSCGADARAYNHYSRRFAQRYGHREVVSLLKQAGRAKRGYIDATLLNKPAQTTSCTRTAKTGGHVV